MSGKGTVPCPLGARCDSVGKRHEPGSQVLREHTRLAQRGSVTGSDSGLAAGPAAASSSASGTQKVNYKDCENTAEFIELAEADLYLDEDEYALVVTRGDTGERFEIDVEEAEDMVGAYVPENEDIDARRDSLKRVIKFMDSIKDYSDVMAYDEAVFHQIPDKEPREAFTRAERLNEASDALRYLAADADGKKLRDSFLSADSEMDLDSMAFSDYAIGDEVMRNHGISLVGVESDEYRNGNIVGKSTFSSGEGDSYREATLSWESDSINGVPDPEQLIGANVYHLARCYEQQGSIETWDTDDYVGDMFGQDSDNFRVSRERIEEESDRILEWREKANEFF